MTRMRRKALSTLIMVACALPAFAQQSVADGDIRRLQEYVSLADRDVSQLRAHDAGRAAKLQGELDGLRDEVIYLKGWRT